ncbi:hypothetical protein A2239_02315 [Candidatus Uhrbacteria bacterium RIFOXYA2_FULL_40_9]|nr:MAG: hypothetical protein A2239_02315 [Candidatus Uhrbacteria bacterium RIFOXYA2_FULL_40_9]OGL97882.1 MAG: hypothetical protein A2332_01825 [Candidatus Uhrbacteria bacterium RIFOXYB2_FULL_41_18]
MKQDHQECKERFAHLGLSADILKILSRLQITLPTPIQIKAIPLILKGKDVIGVAQTGTGKTFAFALPLLEILSRQEGTGLIVVPTRELASQVREEIDRVGETLGFKTALLIGGANMENQIRQLKRQPDVVVATPGRLIDHLERRTVKLNKVRLLVLDEADRMLDMGFAPQIKQILQSVPKERQTLLFSATIPEEIAKIAQGYMCEPVRVQVAPSGTSAKDIEQGVYYVETSNKLPLLQTLLSEHTTGPILVFCRTKHGTSKMARMLNRVGCRTEELHSNRSMNQRRRALENFKNGRSRVMVATDVASRGIDVKEISLVVNYDIPDQNEDYVHRIGRTGRAGHKGLAVSFVLPDQHRDLKAIERLVGAKIAVLEGPGTLSLEEVQKFCYSTSRPSGNGRGNRRGRSQGRRSGNSRQFSQGAGNESQNRGYRSKHRARAY